MATRRPGYWTVDQAMTWLMFGEAATSLMRAAASSMDEDSSARMDFAEAVETLGNLLRDGTVAAIATDVATGTPVHLDASEFSSIDVVITEPESRLVRRKRGAADHRLALGGTFNLLRIRSDELIARFGDTTTASAPHADRPKARRGAVPGQGAKNDDIAIARVKALMAAPKAMRPTAAAREVAYDLLGKKATPAEIDRLKDRLRSKIRLESKKLENK